MATILGTGNGDSLTSGSDGDVLLGLGGSDTLLGRGGNDSLSGSDGDDLLNGGTGADTMSGGDGEDTFVILVGDTTPTAPDVITDWSSDDRFNLSTGPGAYQETSAPDAGRLHANALIAAGARFVAVQTPQGVILYIDSAVNGGQAEDAVLLSGRTLDDISAVNVGSADTLPTAPPGAPEVVTPPTPPTPPTPTPPTPAPPAPPSPPSPTATYAFETITPAQALAYTPTNSLTFTSRVSDFRVIFDDAAQQITLTHQVSGRSVVFSAGLYGEAIGDLQQIYIGTPEADYLASTGAFHQVYAGGGDDVIVTRGGYPIFGGAGRDVFVAYNGTFAGRIADWEPGDRLYLGAEAPTTDNYVEKAVATIEEADAYMRQQFAAGMNYVVIAVRGDVLVHYHADGAHETVYVQTTLAGRGLNDISPTDFLSGTAPGDPTILPLPAGIPSFPNVFVRGNMDNQHLSSLLGVDITQATGSLLTISSFTAPYTGVRLEGSGFTYDGNSQILGGVVSSLLYKTGDIYLAPANVFEFIVTGASLSAASFGRWVATDATQEAFATTLAGNDYIAGRSSADLVRGYGGNDVIMGGGVVAGATDILFGGAGDDHLYAVLAPGVNLPEPSFVGATYMRGDEGNDQITGSALFDDINGNQGDDTAHGRAGEDWVVGGKDNDLLFGDEAYDLVYGNLGNDTCEGGEGNDIVRGGQDNDIVRGGMGNDFLSGDRGDDTLTGGLGADTFNTFAETGVDRVTDFSLAQGDKVQLAPGTQYTLAQVGADTVISMTGGGQMILVGVQLSSLTPGWIFGA